LVTFAYQSVKGVALVVLVGLVHEACEHLKLEEAW
jgi:hypothetical protein